MNREEPEIWLLPIHFFHGHEGQPRALGLLKPKTKAACPPRKAIRVVSCDSPNTGPYSEYDLNSQFAPASLAPAGSQVLQAATGFHRQVSKVRRGVAERLFEHPDALGTGEAMLNLHTGARQVSVMPFLARLELSVAWLFFG